MVWYNAVWYVQHVKIVRCVQYVKYVQHNMYRLYAMCIIYNMYAYHIDKHSQFQSERALYIKGGSFPNKQKSAGGKPVQMRTRFGDTNAYKCVTYID